MTDRTLVVYSSLTGNTKAVAEKIFDIIEAVSYTHLTLPTTSRV